MPSSEFIITLRIWLGIPILTTNALCSCGSPLDTYGDHLLGYGSGPFRIRCHDALCGIIWHALLQDNSNATQEQRATGDSQRRPGDVYHPDFLDSCPTFFNISVRNSLQPNHLNEASTSAGVAAASGEAEKDAKHHPSVEQVGGRFVPLMVESLGLWSPYARYMLRSIASRSTFKNDLSSSAAQKNPLEQLSVKLFSYNAKMILNYLQLTNDDLWDAQTCLGCTSARTCLHILVTVACWPLLYQETTTWLFGIIVAS